MCNESLISKGSVRYIYMLHIILQQTLAIVKVAQTTHFMHDSKVGLLGKLQAHVEQSGHVIMR